MGKPSGINPDYLGLGGEGDLGAGLEEIGRRADEEREAAIPQGLHGRFRSHNLKVSRSGERSVVRRSQQHRREAANRAVKF